MTIYYFLYNSLLLVIQQHFQNQPTIFFHRQFNITASTLPNPWQRIIPLHTEKRSQILFSNSKDLFFQFLINLSPKITLGDLYATAQARITLRIFAELPSVRSYDHHAMKSQRRQPGKECSWHVGIRKGGEENSFSKHWSDLSQPAP